MLRATPVEICNSNLSLSSRLHLTQLQTGQYWYGKDSPFLQICGVDLFHFPFSFPFQVRRQGRKGDDPPRPKTVGVGLKGPGGKNDLTTEDIEAKISEVNSRLGEHSAFDIANPVIVRIKTSPRMKAQLLEQEIESQLLNEFAPKHVQVVFNDGSNPIETHSSEGSIVSFAVDEGSFPLFSLFSPTEQFFVCEATKKSSSWSASPSRKAKVYYCHIFQVV